MLLQDGFPVHSRLWSAEADGSSEYAMPVPVIASRALEHVDGRGL